MRASRIASYLVLVLSMVATPVVVGGGLFTSPQTYALGLRSSKIVAGDLNGDACPDLAVVHYADHKISVLYGQQGGGFRAPSRINVSEGPIGIAVEDFDRDGYSDLAAIIGVQVGLLWGSASGLSGPSGTYYQVGAIPKQVVAGDFNGDGAPDIAVTNGGGDNVSVLYQQSSPRTFGQHEQFAVGDRPFDISAADFNGDGRLDIGASNSRSDNITLLFGDGTGGFPLRQDYDVGGWPDRIASSDLNCDARLDLMVSNNNDGTITLLYGQEDGSFAGREEHAVAQGGDVDAADLNSDGLPDLVVTRANADQVCVLFGQSSGGYGNAEYYTVGDAPFWVVVGDFDRNGGLDIATSNYYGYSVSVLYNSIPEPATLTLLALGGLALLSRKRT
jgi:hypothetical protein